MSTHRIDLPYPQHLGGVTLFLDVSGQAGLTRQHLVRCTAFLGSTPLTLEAPRWAFGERLGTPYCYLPLGEKGKLIELPQLFVGREVTGLRFDVAPWSKTAPTIAVRSMWAKVADGSDESTVLAVPGVEASRA